MKLYIANGVYVGTQAEAKKLDKGFETVEIPTDKPGLIEYLNAFEPVSDWRREIEADEHHEPVIENGFPVAAPRAAEPPTVQDSVDLDDAVMTLPLTHALHLAGLAIERVRDLEAQRATDEQRALEEALG